MEFSHLASRLASEDITSCLIHRGDEMLFQYEQEKGASRELLPVNSCTKSVLSALICIAMDKGLLPGPDTHAGDFFPALRRDPDERKRRITLRHLLTLTAGFRWQEFGGIRSFPKMTRSPDWIQFVLDQPMADEPGAVWTYNSGVSQLLAGMLAQAAGEPISRFAERHLFGPLGIERYEWPRDPRGIHTGGFGLKLTAHDLLRFGLLCLRKGMREGREVVPRGLLLESVKPAAAVRPPERGWYGWHWWADEIEMESGTTKQPPSPQQEAGRSGRDGTAGRRVTYHYARGFGGQFVFVAPDVDAVVVFTRKTQNRCLAPHTLFREAILPAFACGSLSPEE